MSLLSSVGIGLLAVMLALVLKEAGFKGTKLFSVSSAVVIFIIAAEAAEELVLMLGRNADSLGISSLARCLFKLVGVSYVFGVSVDLCRELGEQAVASAVLTAGRVEVFLIGAPYLEELFTLALRLFEEGRA